MRHQLIHILVPPRASLFELATPLGVWGAGRADQAGESPFRTTVCSPSQDRSISSTAGITISGLADLRNLDEADMVVVPTWPVGVELSEAETEDCHSIVAELVRAHSSGSVVVGLCLGAFAVAEAGLLDGRQAVTHWADRDRFSNSFPAVCYTDDSLYVDLGDVITSAGSAAALDCCLHLVRQAHGAGVATRLARSLVTSPHRSGGQTQFVPIDLATDATGPLGMILDLAQENLGSIGSVSELARLSGLSRRSLERTFASSIGISPGEWLADQRVNRARLLLEAAELPIEEIADRVGFGSAATLRRHFRRCLSITPTAYRNRFGAVETKGDSSQPVPGSGGSYAEPSESQ